MMEKYGTDMSTLPVTDDQLRQIKILSKNAGVEYKVPRNRQEADEIIEKLAKEGE